jgi:hypothetical protein
MNKADYFKDQKHISFGAKRTCDICSRYPTEIFKVKNDNYSLLDFFLKGERVYDWYCGNCSPSKTL